MFYEIKNHKVKIEGIVFVLFALHIFIVCMVFANLVVGNILTAIFLFSVNYFTQAENKFSLTGLKTWLLPKTGIGFNIVEITVIGHTENQSRIDKYDENEYALPVKYDRVKLDTFNKDEMLLIEIAPISILDTSQIVHFLKDDLGFPSAWRLILDPLPKSTIDSLTPAARNQLRDIVRNSMAPTRKFYFKKGHETPFLLTVF